MEDSAKLNTIRNDLNLPANLRGMATELLEKFDQGKYEQLERSVQEWERKR